MAVIMGTSNLKWGIKKITVLAMNGSTLAQEIADTLKAEGFKYVTFQDAPKTYADYFNLTQVDSDYVIFVEDSSQCKVKLTKAEKSVTGLRGTTKRDNNKSMEAQDLYDHQLKMIGLEPSFMGALTLPTETIEDMDWYFTEDFPMLYLQLPKQEGVAKAVVEAIKEYFKE